MIDHPNIFAHFDPLFENSGYVSAPLIRDGDRCASKDWMKTPFLTSSERQARRQAYSDCNIGVLAGTKLTTGRRFGFVYILHPSFDRCVKTVLSPFVSGVVVRTSLTIFCQIEDGLKNSKLRTSGITTPLAELYAAKGIIIVPPASNVDVKWQGTSLLEIDHNELPILSAERLNILTFILSHSRSYDLAEGTKQIKAHNFMRALTSSGIAYLTDDLVWLASCLNALLPSGYEGKTDKETFRLLSSAKAKALRAPLDLRHGQPPVRGSAHDGTAKPANSLPLVVRKLRRRSGPRSDPGGGATK